MVIFSLGFALLYGLLDLNRSMTAVCNALPLGRDAQERCLLAIFQRAVHPVEKVACGAALVEHYAHFGDDQGIVSLKMLFADRLATIEAFSQRYEYSFPEYLMTEYLWHQTQVLQSMFSLNFDQGRAALMNLAANPRNSQIFDRPEFLRSLADLYRHHRGKAQLSGDLLRLCAAFYPDGDLPDGHWEMLMDQSLAEGLHPSEFLPFYRRYQEVALRNPAAAANFFEHSLSAAALLLNAGNEGERLSFLDTFLHWILTAKKAIRANGDPRMRYLSLCLVLDSAKGSMGPEFSSALLSRLEPEEAFGLLFAFGDAAMQNSHYQKALDQYSAAHAYAKANNLRSPVELIGLQISCLRGLGRHNEIMALKTACAAAGGHPFCTDSSIGAPEEKP